MNLSDLKKIDDLQQIPFGKYECPLHKDHRWVLPIIFYKQQKNILPYPCTLVMFDAHHDILAPSCKEDILRIKKTGITFDELVNLCREKLSKNDHDWIKAGMELGLIDNAVIFWVGDRANSGNLKEYEEQVNAYKWLQKNKDKNPKAFNYAISKWSDNYVMVKYEFEEMNK